MDQDFLRFGLAAFVTLLVVVDPPGVVPIFVALTKDETHARRRAILTRAVIIAFCVALFFLVAGRSLLSYLGVSVHAFAISGGILLFATAMPMLFGQRGGLQAPEAEECDALQDISVFPLAVPMLSGPGLIATTLLLDLTSSWRPAAVRSDWHRPGISILSGFCLALPECADHLPAGPRWDQYRDAGDGNCSCGSCSAVRFERHHRLLQRGTPALRLYRRPRRDLSRR